MITVSVRHHAAIGHHLPGLGKCHSVHGHGIKIEWTFITDGDLDHPERIDFGDLKKKLRRWVDDNIDHGFLCQVDDPIGVYLLDQGMKVYFMATPASTEAIANELAEVAMDDFPNHALLKVVVHESDANSATWHRPITKADVA